MKPETSPDRIAHEPAGTGDDDTGTFVLSAGGQRRGHLSYTLPDRKTMNIDYVEVNAALRGQGVGKELVDAAVAWADAHGRRVVPLCSYARAVIARASKKI